MTTVVVGIAVQMGYVALLMEVLHLCVALRHVVQELSISVVQHVLIIVVV